MEREIKFRAFNPQIKSMAYNVFPSYNGDIVFISHNDHETEYRWLPIADSEPCLMQFTGLKDKNGKDIYEGDIVSLFNPYNNQLAIGFGKIIFSYEYVGGWVLEAAETEGNCLNIGTRTNQIEVVGNIYENPELLKTL